MPEAKLWYGFSLGLLILLGQACRTPQALTGNSTRSLPRPDLDEQNLRADSLFIEAEGAKQTGDFKKAIADLSSFIQIRPDNATAPYELSRLFLQMQNAHNALLFARRATELDSSNRWFLLNEADALVLNKKFGDAARVFAGLSRRYPTEQQYPYNEAVLLSRAGDYDTALSLLDSLERLEGPSEDIIFQKQQIYLNQGKLTEATAEINKLLVRYPDEPRFYGLLAEIYSDHSMPDSAIAIYRRLLRLYPGDPQALIALALNYKQKGDDSAYLGYMAQAFANPTFNISDQINFLYPFLKYVVVDTSERRDALILCGMVTRAHPGDPRSYSLLGDMLVECRQSRQALPQYFHALALDHADLQVWQQILRVYSAEGANDSLAQWSRKAELQFPDRYLGYYFEGIARFFLREYTRAIGSLRQSLARGIGDKDLKSQVYSLLGESFQQTGNYPASDSAFYHSLVLDPRNDAVLNNFSFYLAQRGENLPQAERMSRASLDLSPDNYRYEDTYAWILYQEGKYRQARDWMEKVLAHPQARLGPGYLEHYGDILYKLNHMDQALRYWKKARNLGGPSVELDQKITGLSPGARLNH